MEYYVVIDINVLLSALLSKKEDTTYLVIGNQKHYPFKDFIVTPAEMVAIIET